MNNRTKTDDVGNVSGELMSVVVVFLLMIVVFLILTAKVGGAVESMLRAQLEFVSLQNSENAADAAGSKAEAKNEKSKADQLEKELGEAKDNLKQQEDQQQKVLNRAKDKYKASRNLQVVVVIDGSGSVYETLPAMIKSVTNTVRSMPEALNSFSIGFVVSQDKDVKIHAVSRVTTSESSIEWAVEKVTDLRPTGGLVDFPKSVRAGMAELDKVANKSRQLLVIFGDVAEEISSRNTSQSNSETVAAVQRWVGSSEVDRRVLALHTGIRDSHREVYEKLGAVNSNSSFGTEPSDLFLQIIKTAFKE